MFTPSYANPVTIHSMDLTTEPTLGDSASVSQSYRIPYLKCFYVCFSGAISVIKTIINQSYWQFD